MRVKIGVLRLSRVPLLPEEFVKSAYRLLAGSQSATASHGGNAPSAFSHCLRGGSLLVAWGDALEALRKKGLRVAEFAVPPLDFGAEGEEVTVAVRHLTPTLLKVEGGPKVGWFHPEAYARSLAGVLRVAGVATTSEEAARAVRFLRVRTETHCWDIGRGRVPGFTGLVEFRIPAAWARPLVAASLTGIGCKRAWGMGNVAVFVGRFPAPLAGQPGRRAVVSSPPQPGAAVFSTRGEVGALGSVAFDG